jgi:hypothetical protein
MPALRFPQYLKNHGLYLLLVANEKYLPGLILGRKGDAFWEHDKLKRHLKVPNLSWQVDQRIFTDENLWLWNPLSEMLAQLKEDKPRVWKTKFKGRYLVLSTWYASKYEVRLGRALKGDLDAKFQQQISPTVGARMNIDSTNKILNVSGNLRVPFAFQGKRLVRI